MGDNNAFLELVLSALSRVCSFPIKELAPRAYDNPLTGPPYNLRGSDLLYLLLLLEDSLGETLDRTAIYQGEFSTINKIVKLVSAKKL